MKQHSGSWSSWTILHLGTIYLWHPWKTFNFCTTSLLLSVELVRIWQYHPCPWTSKLRLLTTPTHPTSIPFGILAAYRLYLVDVSITYNVIATHNSLQLKSNLNYTQYSAVKLKETRLTWNAKNETKMNQNQTPVWNTYSRTRPHMDSGKLYGL